MKFKFAPSLPAQLEPSTFYMIAQGEQLLEIHVTNADASAVILIDSTTSAGNRTSSIFSFYVNFQLAF